MRKQDLERKTTLGELLEVAATLVDEPGLNPEFEHGILALLARTFSADDVASYERTLLEQLAERLDWPIGT